MPNTLKQRNDSAFSGEPDSTFISLCKRLVEENYNLNSSSDVKYPIDAFASSDSLLFSIIPSLSIPEVIERIENDLSTLRSKKVACSQIIYFSEDDKLENQIFVHRIKHQVKSNKTTFEIWNKSTIISALVSRGINVNTSQFTQMNLEDLYTKLLITTGRSYSIFDEIFEFAYNKILIPYNSKKSRSAFTKLKYKLGVNFCNNERDESISLYNKFWQLKGRVEFFISKNLDSRSERIKSLINCIQYEFKSISKLNEINSPVNYTSNFIKIAKSIIPNGKSNVAEYNSCALTIVLFIFEMCDFGEKFDDEQLSLMDQLMESYESFK